MVETGAICAVCHCWRIHGDRTDAGDVFICTGCQADARQFIAIQDASHMGRRSHEFRDIR